MKKIFFSFLSMLVITSSFSQTLDRSKRPAGGPAPKINLKEPVTYKLANGMTIMVVENHNLPQVSASLNIDAGPVTEGSKAGTLDLLSGMLNEGTTSKSKLQFDEAVEQMGASVFLSSGGGGVDALTRYFAPSFALFAEALKSPAFPAASFEKLKSQAVTSIKSNEKNVKAITASVGNALLYGADHASGEMTTLATLDNIKLEDVKAAYKKYITPSRSYLTFVGDITPAAAKALAEKAFGTWKGNALKLEVQKPAVNPATAEINVVDFSNAVQSEIRVANLVQLPMTSPDYFPALLANQILGGGADARLFMNLREKHGYTYGSYSSIGTGRFQSDFSATASVRNEKTDSSIIEIMKELNKMRNEKVSDEELANAKALYNGNFAMSLEDPSRAARLASNILINGLPKDFYTTYLQRINAVTADDVKRVSQKYFNAANVRLIVGGKQEQIIESLKKLGYPVKIYDKDAKPVKESAAAGKTPVAANMTGAQIISKYIAAIGGEAELKKVQSIVMNGQMEVQGQNLTATIKKMAPNMESVEVTMMGQSVMRQTFDGTSGYAMQMGNKQPFEADDIADKKTSRTVFEQIGYLENGTKLAVAGTQKISGADAYKLNITFASGKTKTEFYDVNTGLLVKEEETRKVNGADITSSMEFKDYKATGGIKFPQTMLQSVATPAGAQEFTITIKEVILNQGVKAEDFK